MYEEVNVNKLLVVATVVGGNFLRILEIQDFRIHKLQFLSTQGGSADAAAKIIIRQHHSVGPSFGKGLCYLYPFKKLLRQLSDTPTDYINFCNPTTED